MAAGPVELLVGIAIDTLVSLLAKAMADGARPTVWRLNARKYFGARDFWFRGVENHEVHAGTQVRLFGLLSPFAPAQPGRPRSKVGFQGIDGWAEARDELRKRFQPDFDKDAYDTWDAYCYQDLVWRLPRITRPRTPIVQYAGLYDQYGYSTEAVPVIVDADRNRWVVDDPEWNHRAGFYAEVRGTVVAAEGGGFGVRLLDALGRPIPSEPHTYIIKADQVIRREAPGHKTVLYASPWMLLQSGLVTTEFFDFKDDDQRDDGMEAMRNACIQDWELVHFYFDDVNSPDDPQGTGRQLPGNALLRQRMKDQGWDFLV